MFGAAFDFLVVCDRFCAVLVTSHADPDKTKAGSSEILMIWERW